MIGTHLLIDFYGISPAQLDAPELLADCLTTAARAVCLTPLAPPVIHRFAGGGVTGFLLLAESHIALHSYPEHGYLALDLFSCGNGDPLAAVAVFRATLCPEYEQVVTAVRGREVS